jgi:large subunit ribosomal protein L28
LVQTTFLSHALNQRFSFRVSARGLKTIDKYGGLDGFVLKFRKLGPEFLNLKKNILKKQEREKNIKDK